MTDTPTAVEVDCSTGIVTERPLTQEEISANEAAAAQAEADRVEAEEAAEAEAEAVAEAKASANAKLAALGLTAEEIAALTK